MQDGAVDFALRGDPDRPALKIAAKGEPAGVRPAIAAMPANPSLPSEIALERATRATATVSETESGFAINGAGGADWPAKPLFKVARGSPVSLALVNNTAQAQTLRLEGHVARPLHALDDGWDPYWRDALLIGAGQTLRVAFVADNPGKWPLAAASPALRAKGMKGWYLVA